MTLNILVMSSASKVPLLKHVKASALNVLSEAKVYGADTDPTALSQYFVDVFWNCPNLNNLNIEDLIVYCQRHHIRYIIPTRDGELLYFAEHKLRLRKANIYVMVSDYGTVEVCLDKLKFFERSACGFNVIPTFNMATDNIQSFVVKERFGAGSKEVGMNLNKHAALLHAQRLHNPIFQPYILGSEYSVDIYCGKHGVVGTVVRMREVVVNGESQVTVTVHKPKLEQLATEFANAYSFYGHIIIQVIEDTNEQYHIIECNCRLGGASTLALEVGLNSVKWFLLESMDRENEIIANKQLHKEVRLVRHKEDLII